MAVAVAVDDSGRRVQAIAHRGDPVAFRENTIASIRCALSQGADLVEIDVKTTADGVSVVLHDDTLERLWGDPRRVDELTLAELRAASDAGAAAVGTEHGIPTLAEVLGLFTGPGSSGVMIDMDAPHWADAAIDLVQGEVAADRVPAGRVVWCGNPGGMQRVRRALPAARIFMSWGPEEGGVPDDDLVAEIRPELFNPQWDMITPALEQWARERDLEFCCWTVDLEFVMQRLAPNPLVRGMISNRVGVLVEELERAGRR